MECQFFQWLFAGAGPTTIQHALVGIGCLLAFDVLRRWSKSRKATVAIVTSEEHPDWADDDYRQAA
ncbi:MAG: hypothetical protein IT427_02690 [Pirellulales bacterium]|nr:hypothetical protein [Pirellulales bacterium]